MPAYSIVNASEHRVTFFGKLMTWVGSAVSAVPEPAAWAMLLVGFATVGGMMRKNRKPIDARFRPFRHGEGR